MRLLVNAVSTASSGGLTVLEGLGAALISSNDKIELLVPAELLIRTPLLLHQQQVKAMTRRSMPGRFIWEQTTLPSLALRGKADVLLGLTNSLPLFRGGFRGRRALLIQNVAPFLPEVRHLYRGRARARLTALLKLTISSVRRADVTFLFTQYGRDLVAKHVPDARIVTVPPGLLPIPRPEITSSDMPYVLVIADLYRYKGVEDTIRAIARPGLEDVHIRVCGASLDRAYVAGLVSLAMELGVAPKFHLLGRLSRTEIFAQLRGSICLVQPSRAESLALPLLEALQSGVPVVSTNIGVARELGARLVRFYGPGDIFALAREIANVRRDPSPASLGENIERWRGSFRWSITASLITKELAGLTQ